MDSVAISARQAQTSTEKSAAASTQPGKLHQKDSSCVTSSFLGESLDRRTWDKGTVQSVSVVVPVYNSEASLRGLIQRLEPVLVRLAQEFEVLLVNDGSRDRSWAVIQELAVEKGWIKGVDLMRNFGQHNALLCGVRVARYEIVVTMDDDLQHPPEEIPILLTELSSRGVDVVYGRPHFEQHGLWRNLASRATKLAMERLIGTTNARDISSFRILRTHLRDGFERFSSPFVSIDVLLTWSTTKIAAVDVRREPRRVGKSNYSSWKLLVATVNVITSFSTLPLRAATVLGIIMALFGSSVLLFVLGGFVLYGSVPGFTFLACLVTIFSGTQLFALGIIGEYLGRLFQRSIGRPTYAVRAFCHGPDEKGRKEHLTSKQPVTR